MLPNADWQPPGRTEPFVGIAVTPSVGLNLFAPERGVGLRPGRVLGAAMPEAAIDEHCDSGRSEDDVGASTEAGQYRAVDPESETLGVEGATKLNLRPRVSPSRSRHASAGRERLGFDLLEVGPAERSRLDGR